MAEQEETIRNPRADVTKCAQCDKLHCDAISCSKRLHFNVRAARTPNLRKEQTQATDDANERSCARRLIGTTSKINGKRDRCKKNNKKEMMEKAEHRTVHSAFSIVTVLLLLLL